MALRYAISQAHRDEGNIIRDRFSETFPTINASEVVTTILSEKTTYGKTVDGC